MIKWERGSESKRRGKTKGLSNSNINDTKQRREWHCNQVWKGADYFLTWGVINLIFLQDFTPQM